MSASGERAVQLYQRWEVQQAAYVAERERRFEVMLDLLSMTAPADALVLDLACGPAGISARVLDRFPGMRCIAVDLDPVLLELARHAHPEAGDRLEVVEADLFDPAWTTVLGGRQVHAVLSSTALHWLPAPVLARVYGDIAALLSPGGVVMNADHLRVDEDRPRTQALCDRRETDARAAALAAGASTWEDWWAEVAADPHLGALTAERERRFADRPPGRQLGLGFHVEAMQAAGLLEPGPVWQLLDDVVVLAHR